MGFVVSDVRAFVEAAPTGPKPKTWGKDKEGGTNASTLELLALALLNMHDSIGMCLACRVISPCQTNHRTPCCLFDLADTKAAHIDRTIAKDVIQRLRVRLVYQRTSAEAIIQQRSHTAQRSILENFLVKTVKPKPTPSTT